MFTSELTFRKSQTQQKLTTRTIPIFDELRRYLERYKLALDDYTEQEALLGKKIFVKCKQFSLGKNS